MNSLKKITVWLLATSLVLAAAAMLIPKKAVAAVAAQIFLTNHSVPTSNPLPTRDVGSQTVLVFDQLVLVGAFQTTNLGAVDVSMFKQIRVMQVNESGLGSWCDYQLLTRFVSPNLTNVTLVLDDLNKSHSGFGTQTYEVLPKIDLVLIGGPLSEGLIRVQIYGRTN